MQSRGGAGIHPAAKNQIKLNVKYMGQISKNLSLNEILQKNSITVNKINCN